jgi:hypothetical protein
VTKKRIILHLQPMLAQVSRQEAVGAIVMAEQTGMILKSFFYTRSSLRVFKRFASQGTLNAK